MFTYIPKTLLCKSVTDRPNLNRASEMKSENETWENSLEKR